jgi:diguanylate cyclase (GGDEF)-like protein
MPSLSLYEAVFRSLPVGNYLLSPTPEATIFAVNDAFLKAVSRSRQDLVGVSLFTAFPKDPDDPDDVGEVVLRQSLARVIATGQAEVVPTQRYPIRIDLPNGEVGYQERFWSAMNTPVFDEEGNILCISHSTVDITEQMQSKAALSESEGRLRALTTATADVVYRMSPDWTQLHQLQGRGFLKDTSDPHDHWINDYIPPEDQDLLRAAIDTAIRAKTVFELEHRVLRADGTFGWVLSRAVPMLNSDGEIYEWIGAASDITLRKQAEEHVRQASLHDPLTRLPNRALLFDYAKRVFAHAKRTRRHSAVLFMDLDRFKPINDNYGHEVGDAVLREVARRLTHCMRADDMVFRLGGDEFLVLLPEIESDTNAGDVARHMARRVNQPYHINGLELALSSSVGISIYPHDGEELDTLINNADAAMYQAKQAGRDNIQFYSQELASQSQFKSRIEEQMRVALALNNFELFYQPVIDMQTSRVIAVEALVRWPHTDIGPDQFVPVAEATGQISRLGEWVIGEACRQHKKWLALGLPAIPIAVNVSAVQLRNHDFAQQFARILDDWSLNTAALQIEVTETALMENLGGAIDVLSQLQSIGIRIALDDFGTGYSSLNYLSRLPINKVKVDKSFVQRLGHDLPSQAITQAIIALGRTLKLEVVAEGIESEASLHYLREQGCNHAQGYHVCRPVNAGAFEAWYRTHRTTYLH